MAPTLPDARRADRSTGDPITIACSLVSHTNAGKTTLARTLLGREVGVVRDAPHVTDAADVFTLIEAPDGERLLLWDTPGFGDSARLVRRLRASTNPIGWFMSQVWDRWSDRPFWNAQQAVRNLRDEADVMLYLVNASEAPEAAGYLAPELDLLGWVGKPVVVLLNQLGAPREPAVGAAEVAAWRLHLAAHAPIRAVLPLDAFARCWVQEDALLQAIENALPEPAAREAMARLRRVGEAAQVATFHAAMAALAASLARIAVDVEPVADAGSTGAQLLRTGGALGQRLGRKLADAFGAAIGRGVDPPAAAAAGQDAAASSSPHGDADASPRPGPAADTAIGAAQASLVRRLEDEVRTGTTRLIALHHLDGRAGATALAQVAADFDARLAVDEGRAALWGGAISGALAGLKADLLAGGLTLGGGLVAGGILGALGGAGLARGVNLVRGTGGSTLGWSASALDRLFEAALLRYLAVAHFGRGRGAWSEGEPPAHWREVVVRAAAPEREALAAVWASRATAAGTAGTLRAGDLVAAIEPRLAASAAAALQALYPDAPSLLALLLRESAGSTPTSSA